MLSTSTRILFLALTGWLCLSCATQPYGTGRAAGQRVSALTAQFDQIAFGREFAVPVEKLSRWDGAVGVSVEGDIAHLWAPQIIEQLRLIADLTDLQITLNEPYPAHQQIQVFMDHGTRINRRLIGMFPDFRPPTMFFSQACKSIAMTGPTGQIKSAYIFVSIDQSLRDVRACIIEELAQSMGLFNDVNGGHMTVFDDNNAIDELTQYDQIMMATLYDDRLQTGMPRAEALPIVAQIISELLSADTDAPAAF